MDERDVEQQNSQQIVREKRKDPKDDNVDRYNKNFNHALKVEIENLKKSDLTYGAGPNLEAALEAYGGTKRGLQQMFSRWGKKVENRSFENPGLQGTLKDLEIFCKLRGKKPNDVLLDPNEIPVPDGSTRLQFLSRDAVRQILNTLHREPKLCEKKTYTLPILHIVDSFSYVFLKIYRDIEEEQQECETQSEKLPHIYAQCSISCWAPLMTLGSNTSEKNAEETDPALRGFDTRSICGRFSISGKNAKKPSLKDQINLKNRTSGLWEQALEEHVERIFKRMDKCIDNELDAVPDFVRQLSKDVLKDVDFKKELLFRRTKWPKETKTSPESQKRSKKKLDLQISQAGSTK